jgi:hypothetical protein
MNIRKPAKNELGDIKLLLTHAHFNGWAKEAPLQQILV